MAVRESEIASPLYNEGLAGGEGEVGAGGPEDSVEVARTGSDTPLARFCREKILRVIGITHFIFS
jgi:hypothetical protein